MLSNNQPAKRNQKLQAQISKFQYYFQTILPRASQKDKLSWKNKPLPDIWETQIGQMSYTLGKLNTQGIQKHQLFNQTLIIKNIQEVYSQNRATKINNSCLIVEQEQSHMITFECVFQEKSSNQTMGNTKKGELAKLNKQKCLLLYVIHWSNNVWHYFVEKFKIGQILQYSFVFASQNNKCKFNILTDWFRSKKISHKYLNHYLKDELWMKIERFQMNLRKSLQIIEIKQPSKDIKEHFRRQKQLSNQHLGIFNRLKKQIYSNFQKLNKTRKPNHYFLDNLICRYMLVKQYNQAQSLKSLKQYLQYEHYLRSKYTFQSFNHYHKLKILTYIGNDYEGRPILFQRPHMVDPSKIIDIEEYIDYNMYMLDIYMQDQMEGYVDTCIIIGDYYKFSSANFSLSIVNSASKMSDKHLPFRQFKVVCFNLGFFSYNIFRLVKPFIPKFVLDKVQIFGTDINSTRDYLKTIMDISLIPKYVFNGGEDEQIREKESDTAE